MVPPVSSAISSVTLVAGRVSIIVLRNGKRESVSAFQRRPWGGRLTFRQPLTMQRVRLGRRIDVATRGVPHTRHPADARRCRPIQPNCEEPRPVAFFCKGDPSRLGRGRGKGTARSPIGLQHIAQEHCARGVLPFTSRISHAACSCSCVWCLVILVSALGGRDRLSSAARPRRRGRGGAAKTDKGTLLYP